MVVLAPVEKIRIRDGAVGEVRLALVQCHKLLRMRERKRVQQHPVHHRKNHRVDADSQRERQHHHCRKARVSDQQARAETHILNQFLESS